jgi:integrase
MRKGLVRVGKKFQLQLGVPKAVRHDFGVQKKTWMIDTADEREADLMADRIEREFRAQVLQSKQNALQGDYLDPKRALMAAGWLFGQLHREPANDFVDLSQRISCIITEAQYEGHPLMEGVHSAGVVFDNIVKQVEVLLETSERGQYEKNLTRKVKPPSETLLDAWEAWSKIAKQRPKTIAMYGQETRRFSTWFAQHYGTPYGRAITESHVNLYVDRRMEKGSAKATINHSLSALRLVYKAGRFTAKNPFAGVHDRLVISGDRLTVRAFTSDEMRRLLATNTEDRTALLIAAYSGMRCGEITSLRRKHIKQDSDVWVFDLTTAGPRKTAAGHRLVPIHPVLMREVVQPILGADPEQPLVRCNAGTLSTKLARLIDTVTDDPAVRGHSLRHSFITAMSRNGTHKVLRMAIVGHSGGDVHTGYTHGEHLATLAEQVAKVRYD